MNRRTAPLAAVASLLFLALLVGGGLGCGGSADPLTPEKLVELSTLTLKYQTPGPTPNPCDDVLPVIDGVASDQEWSSAPPLYLTMDGANGTGGNEFQLEIRGIWTDEGTRLGAPGTDRIYLMVRYADDDFDNKPDLLVYGSVVSVVPPVVNPSPIPVGGPGFCDPVTIDPSSWGRLNQGGREDQLVLSIADIDNPTDLVDLNRTLLATVGPDVPASTPVPGAQDVDVWVYRAGRTQYQPVYQFSLWSGYRPGDLNPPPSNPPDPDPPVDRPTFFYNKFRFKCGFFEDLYVGNGTLTRDSFQYLGPYNGYDGQNVPTYPYVRNRTDSGIPVRITQPLPSGRPEDSDDVIINGNVSKELALWWPSTKRFVVCDSIATSRIGRADRWSNRLLPGGYDYMQGWAIQTPTGSSRDVRGSGQHSEDQNKGFSVWTMELMRDLSTGNGDDLTIQAGREYRMVIGVLDASGRTGSGSHEIRIVFEPSRPATSLPRPRC